MEGLATTELVRQVQQRFERPLSIEVENLDFMSSRVVFFTDKC